MNDQRNCHLAPYPLASYLARKGEIDAAIQGVLDRGMYIMGDEVASFEDEFSRYLGVKAAIGVGNGTDALQIALKACGVGPGDEVVTVSHTAVATVAAIVLCGADPVLVDVDPETYTMDVRRLREALTKKTRAVIPVHLYGHPADMGAILDIAEDSGLYVIEDCAQSHGATLNGRKTGVFGDIAAFSFYPTKNLGAFGDGGIIATADPGLAGRARLLREYGWKRRYISEIHGQNSRLDELQAAILRVKLRHLDEDNGRRRTIAGQYCRLLDGKGYVLPIERKGVEHVYHQYVLRTVRRDRLKEYLADHGVGTAVHYPVPVHLQPAFAGMRIRRLPLGVTENICGQILSLPMHPYLSTAEVENVCALIERCDARGENTAPADSPTAIS
ncbi:MAG: UDP-4-amino-4-deoxy-L-arabinose--oxoglutarate aminotransferase [Methanocella sp. PtaU1.Bin125]|nr:MAG: UDP-4-amino-4-deoxy-L-arabinose--oxoglutarate aminotransferase [Methanocella sp. PtaU1.Bin125]